MEEEKKKKKKPNRGGLTPINSFVRHAMQKTIEREMGTSPASEVRDRLAPLLTHTRRRRGAGPGCIVRNKPVAAVRLGSLTTNKTEREEEEEEKPTSSVRAKWS